MWISLQRYHNAVMDQLKEFFWLTPMLVKEVGIYQALLQGITQNNMGANHGTLDHVMALKAVVHVREKGVKSQQLPLDKLSVDQFVQVLAFLASRCELKDVTLKVRANMWNPSSSSCLRASRGGEAEADASVRRGAAAAEVS